MDVRVSGHQVETGGALQEHVATRVTGLAERYFSRAIGAHVTFGKGPHDHGFTCDIVAPVAHGMVLKASTKAPDAHIAFDAAADKIERQLRRYVGRLREHKGAGEVPASMNENAAYTVFAAPADEPEVADYPPIVAETRVDIPEASVGDAVMMMDLRNTTALMFRNSATGNYNMVYRREDGTVGWVEPKAT